MDEDIICPHCEHVQEDIFELNGAYVDGEYTCSCGSCAKDFEFRTDVSFIRTTKRKCMHCENWDWDDAARKDEFECDDCCSEAVRSALQNQHPS